ncbi:MAG: cytidine deaminase [Candidatus Cyclonatronum sp.]|uniref:cytidine deaminase n=1 Tax=Cyclonatronum sp. TaxID=3024185 RepID=UPI0025BB7B1E|nr:cytidine deaminase [Cyclonatronum sp.]MCC5932754.1 cytidine deaminase [Balneolales bacterium]MCH8486119.1 cytidine deaminase [Cyclonatronum sp.]
MNFKKLSTFSYVPYSGKPQACVIQSVSGHFYPGVRIENISYPLTIGRIQAAVFSCIADGEKPETLILPDEADTGELLSYWETTFGFTTITDADFTFSPKNLVVKISGNIRYDHLLELCKKAVIPNSSFPVAALLQVNDGFIPGVNAETTGWELGLCAERIALSRAISAGYGPSETGNMYIAAPMGDYVSPCGACRQVMMEHIQSQRIHLYQNHTELLSVGCTDLLPYHFSSDELSKKSGKNQQSAFSE